MKKSIVINLMGAPCAGKSTFATLLFATLKKKGVSCEYVDEFAKDLVWEDRTLALNDQLFMLANQNYKIVKVAGKVNVVITDSPLPLNIYYNKYFAKYKYKENLFNKVVLESFNKFDNFNYYLERNFPYVKEGRNQTEKQSIAIDLKLKKMLQKAKVPYTKINNDDYWLNKITQMILLLCSIYKNYTTKKYEYERRFLVQSVPKDIKGLNINQTYLALGQYEKRIRQIDDKYYFTEKIGNGKIREEFEKEIDKDSYNYLLSNFKLGKTVQKTRYLKKVSKDLCFEFNHFLYPKKMALVEVEFKSVKDMKNFVPPKDFGKEVTNDKSYKTAQIALFEN